jgi:hypothetical protein
MMKITILITVGGSGAEQYYVNTPEPFLELFYCYYCMITYSKILCNY